MRKPSNHILFWIVYTLYFYLSVLIISPEKFTQIENFFKHIFISVLEMNVLFYTLIYWVFPNTLPKKNYQLLFATLCLLIITAALGNAGAIYLFCEFVKTSPYNFYKSCAVGLNNLYLSINFALAYWFATNFVQNVREQNNAELQRNTLEQSILEAELSSLKNQINPHFFYNSLNFLYAQALPLSKRLSESVMLLSEMLRYTIKENDMEGKVCLEQEIKYIKNYIKIKQLQFSEPLQVNMELLGNTDYRRILPLTLSPFIENAIKYGDLQNSQKPVKISLSTQANQLYLTIIFNIRKDIDVTEVHEDLKDVRRRLYIAYFNKHSLKISDENNIQKTFLRLTL